MEEYLQDHGHHHHDHLRLECGLPSLLCADHGVESPSPKALLAHVGKAKQDALRVAVIKAPRKAQSLMKMRNASDMMASFPNRPLEKTQAKLGNRITPKLSMEFAKL